MSNPEPFAIKLPLFEGPFDLLLFFIEKDELDIQDIPIARITDDFLEYIHHLNSLNMEVASEFIFVAATLMRIKAKTLLPRIELDENGEEIDLKQDLIRQLIAYKQFKEVSVELRSLEEYRYHLNKRGNIHADLQRIEKKVTKNADPEELQELSLYKLFTAYRKVMQRYQLQTSEPRHTVDKYPYSIEEQKQLIRHLLTINQKLDFGELVKSSKNKVHFVYNFLAILELLQQELVKITMGTGFNNFYIYEKQALPL